MARTNKQVEVIIFKNDGEGDFLFLMLKRNEERGGFWQPMTGGVEEGESFEETVHRELWEETGVKEVKRFIDTKYSFEFGDEGAKQIEKVFGVEIDENFEIQLSEEHTEMAWVKKEDALNNYLKWLENKEGLEELCKIIKNI